MAEQENPQSPGIFGTVMSYIPGYGGGTTTTEDHKKTSEHSENESHKVESNTGTGRSGNVTDSTSGGGLSSGTGTGKFGNDSSDYGTNTGSDRTNTGSGNTGHGTGSGVSTDQGFEYGAGQKTGKSNYGISTGNDGSNVSQYGTGYRNTSNTYGSGGPPEKSSITYEDADDSATGYNPQGGSSTGTHHSGYKPQGGSTVSTQGEQTTQDDGVRGAPIEGDGVKGYAIGAPVGSGDTERPSKPGDPSGQVSGAHLEYNPEPTDTRDSSGRGTLDTSQGTGDSSFANVKTTDGQGNSSHVMTRSNESHMHSSSVTQM